MDAADLTSRLDNWSKDCDTEESHYRKLVARELRKLIARDDERRVGYALFLDDPEGQEAAWDGLVLSIGLTVANMLVAKTWAADLIAESHILEHFPDASCDCERCDYTFELEVASSDYFPERPGPWLSTLGSRRAMRCGLWWHHKREEKDARPCYCPLG